MSEHFYNAYCCVAPAFKSQSGKDCPVHLTDDPQSCGIGYLSAGDHVEVTELAGQGNQYWKIQENFYFRYPERNYEDENGKDTEIYEKAESGWVLKGHLDFLDKKVKVAFEKEAKDRDKDSQS